MDWTKQRSPAGEPRSSLGSIGKCGTGTDLIEDITDDNNETIRRSEDREKCTPRRGQTLSGTEPQRSGGSDNSPRLEEDSAHKSIKPPNQTWTEFFGLSTEDNPVSSICKGITSHLEDKVRTPNSGVSHPIYSEDCALQNTYIVTSGTPIEPSLGQSGDRHGAPHTFPRVRSNFHVLRSFQDQGWKVENSEPEVPRNKRPVANWAAASPTADRKSAGNSTVRTRPNPRPEIKPQRRDSSLQSQIVPAVANDSSRSWQRRLPTKRSSSSNDMAAAFQRMSGDARRYPSSNHNRPENRPPMSNVLCRNGPQCRKFQEGTCNFNHDFSSISADVLGATKKSLNVESPAFTPTLTPNTGNAQPARVGISPKAAAAAAFTPRGSGTVTPATKSHSKEPSTEFIPQQAFQAPQQFNEFVPGQSFIPQQQMDPQAVLQNTLNAYSDPFLAQPGIANLDGTQPQLNPYAASTPGVGGQQFFQDTTSYKHPLNYHLYASIGPRRENLMAYQRSTSDFFVPDNLREDLQRKAEATLQTFANSTLPQSVEYFHSLVALDTNSQKGSTTFGYPSWVYKATSSRDGHTYALRRIEGFRLTSEAAIRTVQNWKRISNSSLVQVHDAFTGRWFNDSSLIVVTDYHPMAQTLVDKHFAFGRHAGANRSNVQIVPENELWAYIVQIGSALKAIHEGGLAAQTVIPLKILLTSRNRVRLNGCGVLDIVQYEHRKPVNELQRVDLEDLGRLILGIAARNQTAHNNVQKALDVVSRSYTERLRACIAWLVTPPPTPQDGMAPTQQPEAQLLADYNINTLLNNIADKVISVFDSTLHFEDELTSNFMRELENGRLVRLLAKLNVILERPESSNATGSQPSNPNILNQPSTAWSETGERYYLKLFRDYVFHQVDQDGRPVLDLGHMISCLNKLDAGIDEKIQLVSRDEQNVFIVTYREIKRGFESAWADISKASNARR